MGRLGKKKLSPAVRAGNVRDSLHTRFQIPEEVPLAPRDPPSPPNRGPKYFLCILGRVPEPTSME